MDIRHLRHFLAVADALHFGQAARHLNMEQAPLSQSIKRFEDQLGTKLFVRSKRGGTKLSPAGARMVDSARETVAKFDQTISEARDPENNSKERISMGFVTAGLFNIIPEALQKFQTQYTNVEVRIIEGKTKDLIEKVASSDLDLALTNSPTDKPPQLEFELLRKDRTMIAVPKTHPLATGPRPKLEDLIKGPLILFDRVSNPTLYDWIMPHFTSTDVNLNSYQHSGYTPTILSLVAAGLGIALVQESARALINPQVVMRQIADLPAEVTWNMHLVWNPANTTIEMKSLIELIRKAAH